MTDRAEIIKTLAVELEQCEQKMKQLEKDLAREKDKLRAEQEREDILAFLRMHSPEMANRFSNNMDSFVPSEMACLFETVDLHKHSRDVAINQLDFLMFQMEQQKKLFAPTMRLQRILFLKYNSSDAILDDPLYGTRFKKHFPMGAIFACTEETNNWAFVYLKQPSRTISHSEAPVVFTFLKEWVLLTINRIVN